MVSTVSVKQVIEDAAGSVLLLMQEGDTGARIEPEDWADEMYLAWEHLKAAAQHLDKAMDSVEG